MPSGKEPRRTCTRYVSFWKLTITEKSTLVTPTLDVQARAHMDTNARPYFHVRTLDTSFWKVKTCFLVAWYLSVYLAFVVLTPYEYSAMLVTFATLQRFATPKSGNSSVSVQCSLWHSIFFSNRLWIDSSLFMRLCCLLAGCFQPKCHIWESCCLYAITIHPSARPTTFWDAIRFPAMSKRERRRSHAFCTPTCMLGFPARGRLWVKWHRQHDNARLVRGSP